jgi:hypothetical protein
MCLCSLFISLYSPVVIDGIKGDGVFSVLCLGVTVVNGALILMTVGRSNLCNRTFPVCEREEEVKRMSKHKEQAMLTVIKLGILLDKVMMAHREVRLAGRMNLRDEAQPH